MGASLTSDLSLELHADGATYFGHRLWHSANEQNQEVVLDLLVVDLVATGLHIAARHATENAGTWGTALVEARILGPNRGTPLPRPMIVAWDHTMIGQGRRLSLGVETMPNTVELYVVPPSRHTVDLSAISASSTEWLLAARLVASDLLQAFGVPEVLQIGPSGQLRSHYWGNDNQAYIGWANRSAVEVDHNPLSWF
jgi:hypothetical protein